jgi:hypothetical protein
VDALAAAVVGLIGALHDNEAPSWWGPHFAKARWGITTPKYRQRPSVSSNTPKPRDPVAAPAEGRPTPEAPPHAKSSVWPPRSRFAERSLRLPAPAPLANPSHFLHICGQACGKSRALRTLKARQVADLGSQRRVKSLPAKAEKPLFSKRASLRIACGQVYNLVEKTRRIRGSADQSTDLAPVPLRRHPTALSRALEN